MLDVKLRVKDWLGIGECNHAIQSRGSGGERLTIEYGWDVCGMGNFYHAIQSRGSGASKK